MSAAPVEEEYHPIDLAIAGDEVICARKNRKEVPITIGRRYRALFVGRDVVWHSSLRRDMPKCSRLSIRNDNGWEGNYSPEQFEVVLTRRQADNRMGRPLFFREQTGTRSYQVLAEATPMASEIPVMPTRPFVEQAAMDTGIDTARNSPRGQADEARARMISEARTRWKNWPSPSERSDRYEVEETLRIEAARRELAQRIMEVTLPMPEEWTEGWTAALQLKPEVKVKVAAPFIPEPGRRRIKIPE